MAITNKADWDTPQRTRIQVISSYFINYNVNYSSGQYLYNEGVGNTTTGAEPAAVAFASLPAGDHLIESIDVSAPMGVTYNFYEKLYEGGPAAFTASAGTFTLTGQNPASVIGRVPENSLQTIQGMMLVHSTFTGYTGSPQIYGGFYDSLGGYSASNVAVYPPTNLLTARCTVHAYTPSEGGVSTVQGAGHQTATGLVGNVSVVAVRPLCSLSLPGPGNTGAVTAHCVRKKFCWDILGAQIVRNNSALLIEAMVHDTLTGNPYPGSIYPKFVFNLVKA